MTITTEGMVVEVRATMIVIAMEVEEAVADGKEVVSALIVNCASHFPAAQFCFVSLSYTVF